MPDRGQDPYHVGARHLRDRHLADPREDVALRLFNQTCACRVERQPGRSCFQTLWAVSAKVGIDSARRLSASGSPRFAGQLPVRERLLPSFLERDQGVSTEPELPGGNV